MSQNPWGSTTEERRENLLSTGLSLGVDPKLLHNRPMSDIQKTVENAQSIQKAKSEEADAMGKFIDDYLGKKSTANAAVNAGNNPAQPIVGLQMMQIGAGVMIQQNPPHAQVPVINGGAAGEGSFPFKVTVVGSSFYVQPGTFSGIVPTINGTPMDAENPPLLTPAANVYLHVSANLLSQHGYVYSYTWGSIEVKSGSSVPEDDLVGGEYYIPIATFENEQKTMQAVTGSLVGFIQDAQLFSESGAAKGVLYWYQ